MHTPVLFLQRYTCAHCPLYLLRGMPQWNYGQNSVEISFIDIAFGNQTRYGSMLFAFLKRRTINLLRAGGGGAEWFWKKNVFALIIYCNHFSHVTSAENKTDTFRESIMQNFTQEKNYHASTYPEKKNSLRKCAKKSHVYRLYQSSHRPLPPNKLSNGCTLAPKTLLTEDTTWICGCFGWFLQSF